MSHLTLLQPLFCSARNRFLPPGRFPLRTVAATLFSLTVCIVMYLVSVKVVGYFHSQNELGIILSLKIFQMAWIILFAMLIFSGMVSAVSAMYLSEDNEIVWAAPISPEDLYFMRFFSVSVYTSWMMIVFSMPVFAAYGRVFRADLPYWIMMPLAVTATAAIATAIATGVTILLVNLFPARRTKDIILYLSLCFGIFIYIIFRLLRPEDLVNPDKYSHFVDYLSTISTPAAPYIPAAWSANLLSLYLLNHRVDFLLLALVLITPIAFYFLAEYCMGRWFMPGYSKSQESFSGYRRFTSRGQGNLPAWRWIFAKESKSFIRDSTEWSQLFMIAALIVVYLYNFKMLPVERSFLAEEYITNIISFLNIGLAGFIATSLTARFVYPSIGAEGGSFFIIQSSPISLGRFLLYKYLYYVIPFTLLAVLLVAASDHLLNVKGTMWWFSMGSILLITWTVVALGLGFGAINADFKAASRASALGGLGAIIFLFTAMSYEIIFLFTGFFPAYRLVRKGLRGVPFDAKDYAILTGWIIMVIIASLLLAVVIMKKGIKSLENRS
ncbi:MAG: hypothetical protein KJ950_11680 [Proteobacteria bacterium]|nr:hypothetical protein [Pseudomonadota bacterium]MBU1688001.1 hypothetical protein [Pseudomonadota bacterium]